MGTSPLEDPRGSSDRLCLTQTNCASPVGKRLRPIHGAITVWLALILLGMAALAKHQYAPGESVLFGSEALALNASPSHMDDVASQLVVYLHPECPCSEATVEELDRMMTRCGSRLTAKVMMFRPDGVSADWGDTNVQRRAARIPGVVVGQAARFVVGGAQRANQRAIIFI